MNPARRIIPCLDTDGERVVKGVRFANLRDAGDPAALARRYDAEGADEIVVLDITASRDGRATFTRTISRVAAELSIPLAAGGGIRTLADAARAVEAGADRVTINTAALRRPDLIGQIAGAFGVQAVVVAIDAIREGVGWEALACSGAIPTSRDAVEWAREAADRGAGEIMLTSVDRDGTAHGFDCELTRAVASSVCVPVIASGGAGKPDDFVTVFRDGAADAALAASTFHDGLISISALKSHLAANNILVRLT